jgi:hypothetical protein
MILSPGLTFSAAAGSAPFANPHSILYNPTIKFFREKIFMSSHGLPSKSTVLLFVLAALLLASLGCNTIPFLAPTPTPTATSTSTPTETPTRTSTPTITQTFTPSLTPTQSYLDWPVVLSDSFDGNSNGWYEGTDTDEYVKNNVSITGGQYLFDVTAVKSFFWGLSPNLRNLTDFYLTADVENKTGPASADYGLVFRMISSNKYFFAIAAQSQLYSFQVLNNNQWTTIVDWTSSSQINTSGSNQIGVLARGASFTFFINGEQIDQIDDTTLKTGKVGVGLSMSHAGDNMLLAFDNFEVRAPKTGG